MKYPDSKWRVPVTVAAYALAGTTASLRIASGSHFSSDVLAGALIGSFSGFIVPFVSYKAGWGRQLRWPELRWWIGIDRHTDKHRFYAKVFSADLTSVVINRLTCYQLYSFATNEWGVARIPADGR